MTARAGSTVAVHLRDPLVLDGVTLAPAGTKARLVVGAASTSHEGMREAVIALDRFSINAGSLPVRPVDPTLPAIEPGTTINARTQAIVERVGERYSIRIPFPFPLSADKPAAAYTPTPARTAPPHPLTPPRRSPSPVPTTGPPGTDGLRTAAPGIDAAATAQPDPSATKIP